MEKPIFWHQGLFLQPHHFQLEDRYVHSLLSPSHRFIQPYFWGVGRMDIQEAALSNLSFQLTGCELLFQDHTHVVSPGNAIVEPRSFETAWTDGGKPFTVYAGLRKFSTVSENVTVSKGLDSFGDVLTRFVTDETHDEVIDLYQGTGKTAVKRLDYLVKIFWENEVDQLDNYLTLPLAQVERRGDKVVISERFFPPCLSIAGSHHFLGLISELLDQLAAKSHQLEGYKKDKGIQAASFGARDMVYLLALRTVNRYVATLHQLVQTQTVHPWTVYLVLRQLVGELSTFSSDISVMGEDRNGKRLLADYDHRRLWECFSGAVGLVTRLMDLITAGPEHVLQLDYDGTYFGADLPAAMIERGNSFYLVFGSAADPAVIRESLNTTAKLGSRESLPMLIARALPGITLASLEAPPQELPRRAHSIYFKIDHHQDLWGAVKQNKNIALFWDEAPEDLNVEMMVVEKR